MTATRRARSSRSRATRRTTTPSSSTRAPSPSSTKPTTGQDAELEGVQRILVGEQFMTVYKATSLETDATAQLAAALAQGEDPPEGLVNDETDNGAKMVPSVILTPVAVTIDNLQDTVFKDNGELGGPYQTAQDVCTAQYAQACKEAGLQ